MTRPWPTPDFLAHPAPPEPTEICCATNCTNPAEDDWHHGYPWPWLPHIGNPRWWLCAEHMDATLEWWRAIKRGALA